MRIPLVAGRALSDKDKTGGPTVAVINEEIARAWWKDPRSAVGGHIKLGGGRAGRKLGGVAVGEQSGLRRFSARCNRSLLRCPDRISDCCALNCGSALARHAN
jgi:hypothetical protein